MAELKLYEQLAERHGHYCPMSTLGVRLGEAARERMTLLASKGWEACYLARTCAADGISIILEQASSGVELQVEQQGQHRLQCRANDTALFSLVLTEQALRLAAGYRELSDELKPHRLELLRTAPLEQLIEIIEG